MPEPSQRQSPEESFRSNLGDVLVVMDRLTAYCTSLEEAIEMVRLALNNNGQLRMFMESMSSKGQQKQR